MYIYVTLKDQKRSLQKDKVHNESNKTNLNDVKNISLLLCNYKNKLCSVC